MRKVDPQLQAVREAAQKRFLAQKATSDSPPGAPPAAPGCALPAHLAHLTAEQLQAPIGSLLADAPPEYRPAKKPRVSQDPNAIVVPKDKTAEIAALLAQPAPPELTVLTWNIDGLDEIGGGQGLALRMLSVAKAVARHRPLAVLLQEAIPPALELLSSTHVLGAHYEFLVPKNPPLPYYVAILLDKKRLKRLGDVQTTPFPGSQMGRQLLSVVVELVGASPSPGPLLLATAHLESTKDHATERKKQLMQSLRFLQQIVKSQKGQPVAAALLGGDLNIRDDEVKAVHKDLGDEALGLADVWSFCGAPEAERWTWDTTVNSNVGANFACKTRFDRMLFISPGISDAPGVSGLAAPKAKAKAKATPAAAAAAKVVGWRPKGLQLLGKEKVQGLGRFPSDHWGVLTTWATGDGAPAPAPAIRFPGALAANGSASREVIDLDA